MKIFAIMLVKNEADIVGYVLKEAEKWADKIFILDNGSTDGTWELIQSMKNDIIIPWKQYFGEYHNGLRADVYNQFKYVSKPGDWWCFKLDADEVYAENPREFLPKISKKYQMVAKQSIDYIITKEDIEEYGFSEDAIKNISFQKYYRPICWSEGRFFRYRKGLKWNNDKFSHYPKHIGVQAPQTILVRHYQYRSPKQMQMRLDIRNNTAVKKAGLSWKGKEVVWQDFIKPRAGLAYDDGDLEKMKRQPINQGTFKQNALKNFVKRILIFLHLYN